MGELAAIQGNAGVAECCRKSVVIVIVKMTRQYQVSNGHPVRHNAARLIAACDDIFGRGKGCRVAVAIAVVVVIFFRRNALGRFQQQVVVGFGMSQDGRTNVQGQG
jgi:hypothetical protein